VSYLPQHYRIISRRSSFGLSPYFVLLGTTSGTCQFANILVLPRSRADVACCKEISGFACFAGLLGIAQVGVQWSCFTVMCEKLYSTSLAFRRAHLHTVFSSSLSSSHEPPSPHRALPKTLRDPPFAQRSWSLPSAWYMASSPSFCPSTSSLSTPTPFNHGQTSSAFSPPFSPRSSIYRKSTLRSC
jgi:PQ loop repeat